MPTIPSRLPLESQTQKGVSKSEGLLTSTGLAMASRPTQIAAPLKENNTLTSPASYISAL